MSAGYEEMKKELRSLVNNDRARHPERMNWTADEWISELTGMATLSHAVFQDEETEGFLRLVNCPEIFQRIMIELEDERIFDEPELN